MKFFNRLSIFSFLIVGLSFLIPCNPVAEAAWGEHEVYVREVGVNEGMYIVKLEEATASPAYTDRLKVISNTDSEAKAILAVCLTAAANGQKIKATFEDSPDWGQLRKVYLVGSP